MGYRDDFYKEDHIIGYTGKIGEMPTVYFADAGGASPKLAKVDGETKIMVSAGHITQAHSDPTNVGRGAVVESSSFSIYNNADGTAEECIYGARECERLFGVENRKKLDGYGEEGVTKDGHYIFHPSRHAFVPVSSATHAELAKSITRFQTVKEREKGG